MDLQAVTERFKSTHALLHVEGVAMLRRLLLAAGPSISQQDPSYAFALRSLSSPFPSISQAIVTLIEDLVASNRLKAEKAFSDLVDAIPSIICGGTLHAVILSLLQLQSKSPTLDNNSLPFISMLDTRKDAAVYLISELSRLHLASLLSTYRSLAIRLLLSQKTHSTIACTSFLRMNANEQQKEQLYTMIISCVRTNSLDNESLLLSLELLDKISSESSNTKSVCQLLLQTLIELLFDAIESKQSVSFFTERISSLLTSTKSAEHFTELRHCLMFLLSAALGRCTGTHDRQSLLSLLGNLLRFVSDHAKGDLAFVSLASIAAPLLEIVASPIAALNNAAQPLLTIVLTSIRSATFTPPRTFLSSSSPHAHVAALQHTFAILTQHCSSPASCQVFIKQLTPRIASFTASPSHSLTTIVSLLPIFVLHSTPHVRELAFPLIRAAAAASPSDTLVLLPLLINHLTREELPDLQLSCIQTIASLATFAPGAAAVFRALKPLLDSAELSSVSLRLLVQLWRVHQRFWPRLHRTLEELHKRASAQYDTEMRIAIAASLLDVCEHGPQHAPDVIAMLEIRDKAPISSSICIQALVKLCDADELDWRTCWQVIRSKVSGAQHPLVKTSLMEFFALAKEEVRERDLEADAEADDVQLAWQFITAIWAGFGDADARVRHAALMSFLQYLQVLPSTSFRYFISRLNPTPTALLEPLLSDGDERVRSLAARLYGTLGELEVSQRRTPQQSRTKTTASDPLTVALLDCKNHLIEAFMRRTERPRLAAAKASAMLWIGDVSQSVAAGKRLVQELIQDVRASDNEFYIMQLGGWLECMRRVVTCALDEAADETSISNELVASYLQETTKEVQSNSPANVEASLLSLGALAHALPSAAHASVQKLREFIAAQCSSLLSGTRSGAVVALALLVSSPAHPPPSSLCDEISATISRIADKADDSHEQFCCFLALGIIASVLPSESETTRAKVEHLLRSAASSILPFAAASRVAQKVGSAAAAGAVFALGYLASSPTKLNEMRDAVHSKVMAEASAPPPSLVLLDAHLLALSLHDSKATAHSCINQLLKLCGQVKDASSLTVLHSAVCYLLASLLAHDDAAAFASALQTETKWIETHLLPTAPPDERRAAMIAFAHFCGVGLLLPASSSALNSTRLSSKVLAQHAPFAPAVLQAMKAASDADDSRLCATACAVLSSLVAAETRSVVSSSATLAAGTSVVKQLYELIAAPHPSVSGLHAMEALASIKSSKRLPSLEWSAAARHFIATANSAQAKAAALSFLCTHASLPPVQEALREQLQVSSTTNDEATALVVGSIRLWPQVADGVVRAALREGVLQRWTLLSHAYRLTAIGALDEALQKQPTSAELRALYFSLALHQSPSLFTETGVVAESISLLTELAHVGAARLLDSLLSQLKQLLASSPPSSELHARAALLTTIAATKTGDAKQAVLLLQFARTWALSQSPLSSASASLIDVLCRLTPLSKLPASWLLDSLVALPLSPAPIAGLVYFLRLLLHNFAVDLALLNETNESFGLLPFACLRYCQQRTDRISELVTLLDGLIADDKLAIAREDLIFSVLALRSLAPNIPLVDLCSRLVASPK